MTPIAFNPASVMNLADVYRQQQEVMERVQQATKQVGQDALAPMSSGATSGAQAPVGPFGNYLSEMVREVNGKQQVSTQMVAGLLAGQDIPLHRAVIAMEEASVAFQMMVEVRNKLLEGYQELMRMQV